MSEGINRIISFEIDAVKAKRGADVLKEALSELAKGFLDTARQMENFKTRFYTIFKDYNVVKNYMDKINKFAKETPFALAESYEAAAKLMSQGYDGFKNNLLLTLGDLAAASGKSLNQASEMYNDYMTGQFERMLDFGFKASKANGEIFLKFARDGKNVFMKAKDDAVSMQELLTQAVENRGLSNAMLLQSKTFDGIVGQMQGTWQEFQNKTMQMGGFDAIKAILEIIKENFDKTFDSANAEKFGLKVTGIIFGLAEGAIDFGITFVKASGEVVRALSEIYNTIAKIKNSYAEFIVYKENIKVVTGFGASEEGAGQARGVLANVKSIDEKIAVTSDPKKLDEYKKQQQKYIDTLNDNNRGYYDAIRRQDKAATDLQKSNEFMNKVAAVSSSASLIAINKLESAKITLAETQEQLNKKMKENQKKEKDIIEKNKSNSVKAGVKNGVTTSFEDLSKPASKKSGGKKSASENEIDRLKDRVTSVYTDIINDTKQLGLKSGEELMKFRLEHSDLAEALSKLGPEYSKYYDLILNAQKKLDYGKSAQEVKNYSNSLRENIIETKMLSDETTKFSYFSEEMRNNFKRMGEQGEIERGKIIERRKELEAVNNAKSFTENSKTGVENIADQFKKLEAAKKHMKKDAYTRSKEDLDRRMLDAQVESDKSLQIIKQFADGVEGTLSSTFENAFNGNFENIGDSFKNLLNKMAADLAASAVTDGLKNLMGFGGKSGGSGGGGSMGLFEMGMSLFSGFRAYGGMMMPNQPYIAGERGPEIIIPKNVSNAIPNQQSANFSKATGGNSNVNNINITVASMSGNRKEIKRSANQMSRMISSNLNRS